MGPECKIGFADLFRLAHGRDWTVDEQQEFAALDQLQTNAWVRAMAAEAGGIVTEDRVGTDGVTYTAFWQQV